MKRFTTIMICLVLIMSLVSCGNKSDVSGNDKEGVFTELIPSEIYNYTFKGECYTSKLTNVEIIRETTKDDLYDGTAKLTLDDDNLTRTVELTLHGRKYDKGGWNLESHSIGNSSVILWKEKAVRESLKKTYELFTKVDIDYSSDSKTAQAKATFNSNNLDIEENCKWLITESNSIVEQNNNTLEYSINMEIDKNSYSKTYNWKIKGDWYVDELAYADEYGFYGTYGKNGWYSLTIEEFNGNELQYVNSFAYGPDGERKINKERREKVSVDCKQYSPDNCSVELRTEVSMGVGGGTYDTLIVFYPDRAVFRTNGAGDATKEYELKRL